MRVFSIQGKPAEESVFHTGKTCRSECFPYKENLQMRAFSIQEKAERYSRFFIYGKSGRYFSCFTIWRKPGGEKGAEMAKEYVLGMQIDRDFVQITWYLRSMREPWTAGTALPQGRKVPGKELYPIPEEIGNSLLEDEADLSSLRDFLAECLRDCLEDISFPDARIMLTLKSLRSDTWQKIPSVIEQLGILRKNIYLQDYVSSFYYYTVNHKRDLWSGDVALLEYKNGEMIGSVLHIDHSTTPAIVTVQEAGRVRVDESVRAGRTSEEWDEERDRLFFELLKKVFERRNVITCFLFGDYFQQEWAPRSYQYLLFHRHVYQGNNLFSKGACYAAMERSGYLNTPGFLFVGEDVIQDNLVMNMRQNGKVSPYTLISAGSNWYEAHHECEFIVDDERKLTILSRPMQGGREVTHVLLLRDFPERPDRATRLRLNIYFTSPGSCVVELEDLGFGGLYASSGKRWKREIHL